LPVITFDDSLSIHFNGEEIKVNPRAARTHRQRQRCLFHPRECDPFWRYILLRPFPNIDLRSGGSVRGYIANVENAIKKVPADAKLIPGHGPLSYYEGVEGFSREC
jgi:hypothetical protein